MTDESTVEVVNVPERNLYEIQLDGKGVGVELYFDHGEQRVFYATEVDPAYGGRGLGSTLIRHALADAVANGKRIVPVCPFVVRYVQQHNDFAASIDKPTPAVLQLVPTSGRTE